MKICCFAGHANIYGIGKYEVIRPKLKKEIVNLIENEGVTEFYNGCKGNFDWLCIDVVRELKQDYPSIKSCAILAYRLGKDPEYENLTYENFDQIIYPGLENTPLRFAIVKRNEWMVKNSDFLIAYVNRGWGGAAKTLEYAEKKKHIKVVNLA